MTSCYWFDPTTYCEDDEIREMATTPTLGTSTESNWPTTNRTVNGRGGSAVGTTFCWCPTARNCGNSSSVTMRGVPRTNRSSRC